MATCTRNETAPRALFALLVALSASGTAFAQEDGRRDSGERPRAALPDGYAIDYGRSHYWYRHGEWYQKAARDWVVVNAPPGAFVPVLPPFFTTITFGDVPYFYANDTYYLWNEARQQYEVVVPPAGIARGSTAQPAADGQLRVDPKSGASYVQQASDRYECDISAVAKSGYDPTQGDGGVASDAEPVKRAEYFRAEAACLETRGYRVR